MAERESVEGDRDETRREKMRGDQFSKVVARHEILLNTSHSKMNPDQDLFSALPSNGSTHQR